MGPKQQARTVKQTKSRGFNANISEQIQGQVPVGGTITQPRHLDGATESCAKAVAKPGGRARGWWGGHGDASAKRSGLQDLLRLRKGNAWRDITRDTSLVKGKCDFHSMVS